MILSLTKAGKKITLLYLEILINSLLPSKSIHKVITCLRGCYSEDAKVERSEKELFFFFSVVR